MKNILSSLLVSLLIIMAPAYAFNVETPLPNEAQETQAQNLFRQVRCVVCQGQSLADSNAEVAVDMRAEIRNQLKQGKSERQIIDFLSERYGDSIRMQPVLNRYTILLWTAPLWLLLIASGIVWAYFRRRSN